MSRFWSDVVAGLTPYVPGEQPKVNNLVKLNTNESPFGPSPKAVAAMQAQLGEALRFYPHPEGEPLAGAIADYYQLQREQVLVGNGSDEILAFCFQALLKHDLPLLFPKITYNFYPSYCRLFGIDFKEVDLSENFQINLNAFSAQNGGIIFANPNAPTGIAVSLGEIESLLQRCTQSVVVVDEAYVDFGAESAVSLINTYPNLLVVQTFSKSRALAGLRVGFAMGDADLIEAMARVKNSFNAYPLDRIAIMGATAALQDEQHFQKLRQTVIDNRQWLTEELQNLGMEVLPSSANFIFCRHNAIDGATLADRLRRQNVLVRHFKQAPIEQWLRVSIGTQTECQTFLSAIQNAIAGS